MALNHLFLESPKSEKQGNALSPTLTANTPRSPPSPLSYTNLGRQQLNGRELHDTPSDIDGVPQVHSHTSTPTSDRNLQWSSAVGKATTAGKSGRVIERLMSENDRLLREKKLATVQLEEELKRGESARSALESLQVSNENLTSMHESDISLLHKRDRRIQELREDLRTELSRREKAELSTRELRLERDETVESMRREAAEDRELSRRATSQYEVLSKSWKSLEDRYERQTRNLMADIQTLHTNIQSDKEKIAKLEIIIEQLSKEAEKSQKANHSLWNEFEKYKREEEDGISDLRENAARYQEAVNNVQYQMESVLGQMRRVINIKRDVRGAE